MARKRKSRRGLSGLGAVARHGGDYRGRNKARVVRFCVVLHRNIGAKAGYIANAEPCGARRMGRGRYASAAGRTPTAATKKALASLARKLK